MTSPASDGTEDVCVGYSEHRGVRETYRGSDGIQWECTVCGAEAWEGSDGIDFGVRDDYENLPEGASPNWTIVDELVRGEKSREDATTEALRRLEEGPTMPSFSPFARDEALKRIVAEDEELLRRLAPNDGLICKCPAGSHTIEDVTIVGDTGTSLDSAL